MAVKLVHRNCGGQVGWYLRDAPRDCDRLYCEDIQYMDGTHPEPHSRMEIECPACGALLINPKQLHREFTLH